MTPDEFRGTPEWRERMEAFKARNEALVAEYGHYVQAVFGSEDSPSFAYTVGLSEAGWPELICIGVGPEVAQYTLNSIVTQYRKRDAIPKRGDSVAEVAEHPVFLGSVSPECRDEYLTFALDRAARKGQAVPQALQVIIYDKAGVYPGQPGYDAEYMDRGQPCLTSSGQWDFEKEEHD